MKKNAEIERDGKKNKAKVASKERCYSITQQTLPILMAFNGAPITSHNIFGVTKIFELSHLLSHHQ